MHQAPWGLGSLAEGPVPLGSMPCEPAPEAAWLPMKAWMGRKTLDINDIKR